MPLPEFDPNRVFRGRPLTAGEKSAKRAQEYPKLVVFNEDVRPPTTSNPGEGE